MDVGGSILISGFLNNYHIISTACSPQNYQKGTNSNPWAIQDITPPSKTKTRKKLKCPDNTNVQ